MGEVCDPLTVEQATAVTGNAEKWLEPLNYALDGWSINTPDRRAMFLAQCAHESAGFTRLVESLNYSAERLLQVFPKRFTRDEAQAYAFNEYWIGERVYGGRLGNGSAGSGDGFNFRGRGLIQVTGRENYRACGTDLRGDLEANPQWLEDPWWAAASAAWFWTVHDLNSLADAGEFTFITQRINGGTTGLDARVAQLDRIRSVTA